MSYFDSIDTMPIFNWDKCQQGDLTFTRIDDKDVSEHLDAKAWQLLNYEYMEVFGISRSHTKYLMLQKQLICLELELIETGDKFIKNKIRQVREDLQILFVEDEGKKGMTIDQSMVYLSKFMGFRLDKRSMSVKEYFTLLNEYGKKN